MTTRRKDAARSRDAILEAARRHPLDGLRLNDLAKAAGVGVATVYRHFPTVQSLVEELSLDSVMRMKCLAAQAEVEPDAAVALRGFLEQALDVQLADEGVQTVLAADEHELGVAREARCAFVSSLDALLARAQRDGAVRDDLSVDQLRRLVCGVEHAVRLGDPADRRVLLDVVLAGIRTPA
jgi:AcrR family transcriptional regulator